jgi:hypothetical protein
MPSKKSKAALPSIPKELIDQFVTGPMSAEAVNAASMAFKKALIERALGAELSHHLAIRRVQSGPRRPAITATVPAARPCSPTMVRYASRCRAIARAASSRC